MKSWHFGLILAILAGYILGIFFPSVGTSLKAKLGV